MAKNTHKDVEYHIDLVGAPTAIYKRWDQAMGHATSLAVSHGETVVVDCVVWSEQGAKWLYGEDGVTQYREDPDASVFERFEVNVANVGRVA